MKNNYDKEDDYDYWPNELAELSVKNKEKYEQIVNSNLEEGDTIEKYHKRNLEWAQEDLRQQRNF